MSDGAIRFSDRVKIAAAGFLGSAILRILNRTIRWQSVFLDGASRDWPQGPPLISAFWHRQQLLMPWNFTTLRTSEARPMYVLISQHTDGRMIAQVMHHLGVRSVAGSSTRGGRAAVGELVECIRAGSHISITPDGPKGPRYQAKTGAVRIASRTGAPILPMAIGADRKWRFGSWDEMFLPKPFCRGVRFYGRPVHVPPDLDDAGVLEWTKRVAAAIDEIRLSAEKFTFT